MPKTKNTGEPFPGTGLADLPVELIYEIQLCALSPSLPSVCRRLHDVFTVVSGPYRAQYLMDQITPIAHRGLAAIYTKLLRYPICTQDILELLHGQLEPGGPFHSARIAKIELPRRLFRPLVPKTDSSQWNEDDVPLPFLRYLFGLPKIPAIDVNANEGYALSRAVYAQFIPLIQFLLDQGASPACKDNMAIMIAIRQKDLRILKMLIEREDKSGESDGRKKGKAKKRRLEDRVKLSSDMLKAALKRDARDIVHYLTMEKGVVPDLQTLQMMGS